MRAINRAYAEVSSDAISTLHSRPAHPPMVEMSARSKKKLQSKNSNSAWGSTAPNQSISKCFPWESSQDINPRAVNRYRSDAGRRCSAGRSCSTESTRPAGEVKWALSPRHHRKVAFGRIEQDAAAPARCGLHSAITRNFRVAPTRGVVHSIFTPLTGGLNAEWRKLLNPIDLNSTPWTPCTLFSIDVHFPKLDVAGSSPVSRSIFSMVYKPCSI